MGLFDDYKEFKEFQEFKKQKNLEASPEGEDIEADSEDDVQETDEVPEVEEKPTDTSVLENRIKELEATISKYEQKEKEKQEQNRKTAVQSGLVSGQSEFDEQIDKWLQSIF